MNSGTASRWLICRICLRNDNKELYAIFAEDKNEKMQVMENLKEKIELFGCIQISDCSNLPNKICNRCLLLLRASCKFRDLCEQSQRQLHPFARTTEDVNTELESPNVIAPAEPEEDSDNCLLMGHNDHELDEFITEEKQPATPPSPGSTEQSHYSIKGFIQDVVENPKDVALGHDVDHLVDEDTTEYVYEATTESSQDTQDQLMSEDNSNPYGIDHNLHIQYYDDVHDGLDDTKFAIPSTEPGELSEEIENTTTKAVKRKHRAVHSRIKTEDKIFNCQYCDNVYHDKAKYAMHIKIHRQVKPHECEICGKRFSTTPQLSRHMNSHTGNRPYKCKYCAACFGDPSTRIKHERIHTNERPYKCDICPKSFAYSNVLKVHMMVHTGERPHVCSYCDKAFSQIHHKISHEKRHRAALAMEMHENDVDIEDELKEYEIEKI